MQFISAYSRARAHSSACHGVFSGVFADVGFGIRFLRKEAAWQVAPWLEAPGGAGQARPVLFALIDELYKSGGPSRVRPGFREASLRASERPSALRAGWNSPTGSTRT